jgi:P-type Cu+ transporter
MMRRMAIGLGVAAVAAGLTAGATARALAADPPIHRVAIEVSARGFVPASFELEAGVPAELVFLRTTPSRCAAEVHIPELGVPRTALPEGEPVTIRIESPEPGSYAFLCGMNMLRGTLLVTTGQRTP